MRHINIPVFIPHLGCPNDCVFCNQRTISGHCDYQKENVRSEIERALETVEADSSVQIAFFGGSFTGIDRNEMIYLLSVAKEYIDKGAVGSIRLSTRPDYIDKEILGILKDYGVKSIELGIQSMSDKVLASSKRGHTAKDSRLAMELISENGFELVGQMMIGLPESSEDDEIYTAEEICKSGAAGARIYPTVVFSDTELCKMAKEGLYTPLTLDEAVKRSKSAKSVFVKNGVEVIRVGLQSSENLTGSDNVYAGDYHSAIGEMVDSLLYYDIIKKRIEEEKLADKLRGRDLIIYSAPGEVSKVSGHQRENKRRLQDEYYVKNIKVIEKNDILRYNIILSV